MELIIFIGLQVLARAHSTTHILRQHMSMSHSGDLKFRSLAKGLIEGSYSSSRARSGLNIP